LELTARETAWEFVPEKVTSIEAAVRDSNPFLVTGNGKVIFP
jgi:hypothetical protein